MTHTSRNQRTKRREAGAAPAVAVLAMVGLLAIGIIGGWSLNEWSSTSKVVAAPVPASTPVSPVTVTVTAAPPRTSTPQSSDPSPASIPARHTLRGTMQVTVDRNPDYPDNCRGFPEEGYGDLHIGQQVVVSDSNGRVIAMGRLTTCKYSPLESRHQARGILFHFSVPDVPARDFYQVEVAHRGKVTFSEKDLERDGWKVALNL